MAGAVSGGSQGESDRAAARARFFAAYDRILRRFPPGTEEMDLTSDFGSTRVHVSGPASIDLRSRVHHVRRVANRSGRMPIVRVETVDGASHYGLPMTHADQLAALILQGGEN